jgi:hypothetical protein
MTKSRLRMSGESTKNIRALLTQEFEARHVDAALGHFSSAVDKFLAGDWEAIAQKSGKFVEAVAKALVLKSGKTITDPRHFSAGNELRLLEHVKGFPDTLRLVIPRAGIFVYEVVSNRGGRHDAHDIDANVMDARVLLPAISWMLADMVRFCGKSDPETAMELIDELTAKKYPYFEEIDGRAYINLRALKPGEISLLILYSSYPRRINRQKLVDLVKRHGVTASAASTAVHRLKNLVDDADGEWKLRGIGREAAEELIQRVGASG